MNNFEENFLGTQGNMPIYMGMAMDEIMEKRTKNGCNKDVASNEKLEKMVCLILLSPFMAIVLGAIVMISLKLLGIEF